MRALLTAGAVAAAFLASQAQAAAPITYSGSQTIGSGTASYSFTTDGNLGLLNSTDFTAYSVLLTDANGSVTLTQADSAIFLSGTDTSFSSVSPVQATATSLIFTPAGTSYFSGNFSIQSRLNNGDFAVLKRFGVGNVELDESVNGSTTNTATTPSPFVFASAEAVSAAPEPSAWALMLGGVGGIGLLLRRRRQIGLLSKAA